MDIHRVASHRTAVLIVSLIVGTGAVAPACPAWAQPTLRPSASPLAPGDMTRPSFDTAAPKYDGTRPGNDSASTVVADIDGRVITLADVGDAIRALPPSVGSLPFETLFPMIRERLEQREALAIRAQKQGLDEDPIVRRRVRGAADQALGEELLYRETSARVSDADMLARYKRDYAGKPGPTEVRVRVIMVPTEEEAVAVIAELKAGADFAAVARRSSKDTTAPAGGDLGFVARDGLNAEVGAVAFSLPVGQVSAYPVRTAGAWFVVKVEDRRQQPTQAFPLVKEQIRQALLREAVPAVVIKAIADVVIREYSLNGTEIAPDRSGADAQ